MINFIFKTLQKRTISRCNLFYKNYNADFCFILYWTDYVYLTILDQNLRPQLWFSKIHTQYSDTI